MFNRFYKEVSETLNLFSAKVKIITLLIHSRYYVTLEPISTKYINIIFN